MSLPRKCEVCGNETKSVFKLMSIAGKDRVMVRFFCDEACYEPYIAKQNEGGGCSWCGLSVGSSGVNGPMNERYCDKQCYESAGKALFRFKMSEDPGAGLVISIPKQD